MVELHNWMCVSVEGSSKCTGKPRQHECVDAYVKMLSVLNSVVLNSHLCNLRSLARSLSLSVFICVCRMVFQSQMCRSICCVLFVRIGKISFSLGFIFIGPDMAARAGIVRTIEGGLKNKRRSTQWIHCCVSSQKGDYNFDWIAVRQQLLSVSQF